MEFANEGLTSDELNRLLLGAPSEDALDASGNELTEWPDAIRHFAGDLHFLSLATNRIATLPSDVVFPALEYLYLFSNRLTEFSWTCDQTPQLSHLSLHTNPLLRALPLALPPLLRYVNVAFCNLTGPCPPAVFDLPFLEVLFLNDNELSSVEGLQRLTQLTSLEMQKNRLTQLPPLSSLALLQTVNATNEPHIVFRSNKADAIKQWTGAVNCSNVSLKR
jgi:Leucine-rich repeat (LRR) protein